MSTKKEQISGLSGSSMLAEKDETSKEEDRGAKMAAARMTDMFDKTQRAMAAALRLASLCYNSEEIKRLASLDKYGCDWIDDISEGMCALSRIDTNMKERLMLSIKQCPELYNVFEMDQNINDLGVN